MDNTHAVNSPNTGPPTREKHEPWKAYCVDLPDTLTNWVNLSRKPLLSVWWKAYWQLYSLHLSVVLGVLVLQKLKQCYYRHLVAYKWTLVQTNISIMIRERLVGQEFVWCMPDTTMSMKKEKLSLQSSWCDTEYVKPSLFLFCTSCNPPYQIWSLCSDNSWIFILVQAEDKHSRS